MHDPIPLSLIQSGFDLTEPRAHPGGEVVTWVQRSGTSTAIVGRRIDGGPVTVYSHGPDPAPGRGTSGGCYAWTAGGTALVYATSDGEIWFQPADGGAGRHLTHGDGRCRAPDVDRVASATSSSFVVYVVDEARVMLTSLETGATHRLDDGRHEFCFDPAVAPDGSSVTWVGWSPPSMPWDAAERLDCSLVDGTIAATALGDAAIQQPRFMPDGTPIHVHDASGWLNVHIASVPVVAEPCEHAGPTWGMGQRSYDVSPDGDALAFCRNEDGFGSLNVVDIGGRSDGGDVVRLGRGVHGHLTWATDDVVVALRSGARAPTQIVAYRLGTEPSERTTLAVGPNVAWADVEVTEPELVTVTSSDATTVLHARRYVAGDGRLLCWIHGGPTDQWQVDWRPRLSYWTSRGWDVLVVDPRGTTGHGRVYQQGLHGAWGRVDVDDTADLIRHAHRMGWSGPDRTVVIGGSSGGLTALGILADHGDLVAGGVASYPVSDLTTLSEATHRFEAHYTDTLVAPLDGSAESERRFVELSPIHRADRIAKPLLLMHGADDPVVPVDQSRALAESVIAAGGTVEFVEYEGEGHGFRDPAHVADEYARTGAFLARF